MSISKLLANLHKNLRIISALNKNKVSRPCLYIIYISSFELFYFSNGVYSIIVFLETVFNIYLHI